MKIKREIHHSIVLSPQQIAASLGKIVRYAGRGAFWCVLLHSFVVADCLPDNLKFFGLVHDQTEVLLSDIPSPYKNPGIRRLEAKIYMAMSKYQGVRLPTRCEHLEIKAADRRSRNAEIHTGLGDVALIREYPLRDQAVERLSLKYARKYPPSDCIRANGRAVKEFVKRYELYKSMMDKA